MKDSGYTFTLKRTSRSCSVHPGALDRGTHWTIIELKDVIEGANITGVRVTHYLAGAVLRTGSAFMKHINASCHNVSP